MVPPSLMKSDWEARMIYVRKWTPEAAVMRDERVVTIPDEGTYIIDAQLAAEIERLIQRGQLQAAKSLFYWFDTTKED
jgi:hypothetical protein